MTAGKYYSVQLMRRIKALERTILFIRQVELQLDFSQSPVPEIVRLLTDNPELGSLRYLCACVSSIKEGIPFPQAWQESVLDKSRDDALNREDAELLLSFGRGLGTTDLSGQKKLCLMHGQILEDRLENARRQYQNKGKLGTVLGTAAGAVAVILFI